MRRERGRGREGGREREEGRVVSVVSRNSCKLILFIIEFVVS